MTLEIPLTVNLQKTKNISIKILDILTKIALIGGFLFIAIEITYNLVKNPNIFRLVLTTIIFALGIFVYELFEIFRKKIIKSFG